MRTLTNTLTTAQNAFNRQPIFRATVRDVRLRWEPYYSGNTISGVNSDVPNGDFKENDIVRVSGVVLSDGTIVRVAAYSGKLWINRVVDPGNAANKSQWGTWTDIGYTAHSNHAPGLHYPGTGNTLYLFYSSASTNSILYRLTSTDKGQTWSSQTQITSGANEGIDVSRIEPISSTEHILCTSKDNECIRILRGVYPNTRQQLPFAIYGTDTYPISKPSEYGPYQTTTRTLFYTLNGRTFVIYGLAGLGNFFTVELKDGVYSEPVRVLNDDYTRFQPYRVSVIQGTAWLTGRIIRDTIETGTRSMDVVFRSTNGIDWTALDRESYLTINEIRGQIYLSQNKVFYAGFYNVYSTPATYLIDPAGDNPDKKLDVSDDLIEGTVKYPREAMGTLDITLNSSDDSYMTAPKNQIVKEGSEIWLEAGYKTSAGNEYVLLQHAGIDGKPETIADAARQVSISARDASGKRMKDRESPFYHRILSQEKNHDTLQDWGRWNQSSEGSTWTAIKDDFNTVVYQEYSTINKESIYQSNIIVDTINFDLRASFLFKSETYPANRSAFGLIGLMADKNNHWRLEAVKGNTNYIALVHRSNQVDSTKATSNTFTMNYNTRYDFRFVHREGHFWGYIKALTSKTWTLVIDYVATESLLAKSKMGGGYVGVYAHVKPFLFSIYKMDDKCQVIPMKDALGSSWSDVTLPKTFVIENEEINVTSKTPTPLHTLTTMWVDWFWRLDGLPTQQGEDVTWDGLWERINHIQYYRDQVNANVPDKGWAAQPFENYSRTTEFQLAFLSGGNYGWSAPITAGKSRNVITFFDTTNAIPSPLTAGYFDDHAFVFTDGKGEGRAWRIYASHRGWYNWNGPNSPWTNAYNAPSGGGHPFLIVSNIGSYFDPYHVADPVEGGGVNKGVIVPALFGLTRGYNNTKADWHGADAIAYEKTDSKIQVYSVDIFDGFVDMTIEKYIDKITSLVGVGCEFNSFYSAANVNATNAHVSLGNLRSFEIEFDCPNGGGVIFRAADATYPAVNGYRIAVSSSGVSLYYGNVLIAPNTISEALIETVPFRQTPSAWPARVRIVVHDKSYITQVNSWFSVYVNGAYVVTWMHNAYSDTGIYLASGYTYTNVRIPELHEWRDGVRVDENSDIDSSIGQVVQERPIRRVSKYGDKIKYSYFDVRDLHPSIGDIILDDSTNPNETELITYVRIESDKVGEYLADETIPNQNMAQKHGLIFRRVHLPNDNIVNGTVLARRLFRFALESYAGRQQTMQALLSIENEDKVGYNYTATGTGISKPAAEDSQYLIVNDVSYQFGQAKFDMQVSYRRWVE